MRADMLNSILSELNGTSADIEASAVISTDGLIMASQLPQSLDEDRHLPGGSSPIYGFRNSIDLRLKWFDIFV